MNILEIISSIEEHDSDITGRLDSRRWAMRSFANIGKKITFATLPFALSAMFQKAYGQNTTTPPAILDVFNFALTLEHLEYRFYQRACRCG